MLLLGKRRSRDSKERYTHSALGRWLLTHCVPRGEPCAKYSDANVGCTMCAQGADETAEHIILECTGLEPEAQCGVELAVALGFRESDERADEPPPVENTKKRDFMQALYGFSAHPIRILWRPCIASLRTLKDVGMTTTADKSGARSLQLPDQLAVFRNLKNAKRFAIDIGGSLTKIAYYSTVSHKRAIYNADFQKNGSGSAGGGPEQREPKEEQPAETDVETARLHFVKFETRHIEAWLRFVQERLVGVRQRALVGNTVKLTGGGAFKHRDLIASTLGLGVDMEDEMECLINGCNFLLKNITDEVFEYHRHGNPEYKFNNVDPNVFPYLLVNIGSGVSIMKVESEDKYERIGGSATGGGTFWGLGSLMTKAKSFDELLKLAEDGDHRSVDMLVKDIYGGNYNAMGLTSDLIACSFGKTIRFTSDNAFSSRDFSESDIARSLLFMISNDIGQIASLYALMHGLTRVYFGGYFLRGHPLSMHTVSFAINYWSK
ncbi:hypothetical protein HPB47_002498, partial [Ixodes persulcatus]